MKGRSETEEALLHAALETGVAVITPEQAFRDCIAEWNAKHAYGFTPHQIEQSTRTSAHMVRLRATPARPLRVRLCLDEHGPGWLGLLTQCAWLRGGILPDAHLL